MDPWTRYLPIGAPLRTLDSGQTFKGPLSKVLLIPGMRPTNASWLRPDAQSSPVRCQQMSRWLLLLLSSLCDPTVRPSRCGSLLQAAPDHDPRSRLTEQAVCSRAHRASRLFREAGRACSEGGHMSCHIMGMAWYRMGGDVASRQCHQTARGLYRAVPDCTGYDARLACLLPLSLSSCLARPGCPSTHLHTPHFIIGTQRTPRAPALGGRENFINQGPAMT